MTDPLLFDRDRRLRLAWRLAIFLAGYAALQIPVAIAVGALVLLFLLLTGKVDEPAQALELLQQPEALVYTQIASSLPVVLVLLLWVWVCRKFLDRRSLPSMGLGQPESGWLRTAVLGTLAGLAPIAISVSVLLVVDGFAISGYSASLSTWLLVPTLVILGFSEEIAYRGYVLQNFLDSGQRLAGVLVSSLLFWLFHGLNPAAWSSPFVPINLFGAGVVLAMAYLVSGNLWFPTVLHVTWNVTQGVVFQIPVSGLETDGIVDLDTDGTVPAWLTGGAFGLEASPLITACELGLFLFFWSLWQRRKARVPDPPSPELVG